MLGKKTESKNKKPAKAIALTGLSMNSCSGLRQNHCPSQNLVADNLVADIRSVIWIIVSNRNDCNTKTSD